MFIYHYSDKRFDVLKSRAAQKGPISVPASDLRHYDNHISFFVEPIPYDILPSLHHHQHAFYKDGKEVYQYKIPTNNLKDFYFELVESPEKTELFYDETLSDELYYVRLKAAYDEKGYVGTTVRELEHCVKMFQGKTREFFKQVPKRKNYDEIKTKYAPTVPHLMVYLKHGVVEYSEVKKVVMGKRGELAAEHYTRIKNTSLLSRL